MKNDKMQVVHLASGDLWAGAEVQLFTLCKSLIKFEEIEVKVILLNDGELAKRLRAAKIETMVIDESQLNGIQIIVRLIKQLKQWHPNILHTHREKENVLGSISAWLCNIVSLRTVHGAPEHTASWKRPDKKIIKLLDTLSARYIQHKIISVSKELTLKLSDFYRSEKIITIENAVDIEALKPFIKQEETAVLDRPIKIGLVGRLVPVKRIDRFLETAAILQSEYKNNSYEFLIYGEGPMEEQLKAKIKSFGLDQVAHLKGHEIQILDKIRQLDFLLITSDHEGLPMTLLESLFLGTPVIASAVGGIPDAMPQECGTLVHELTASSFAKAVNQCIENEKNTTFKINNAHKRIEQVYSSEQNGRNYLKLYQTSLEQH